MVAAAALNTSVVRDEVDSALKNSLTELRDSLDAASLHRNEADALRALLNESRDEIDALRAALAKSRNNVDTPMAPVTESRKEVGAQKAPPAESRKGVETFASPKTDSANERGSAQVAETKNKTEPIPTARKEDTIFRVGTP